MRPTTIRPNGKPNVLEVHWGHTFRAVLATLVIAVSGQGLLLWRSAAVAENRLRHVEDLVSDHLAWSRQEVPQLVTREEWIRQTQARDKQMEEMRAEFLREFDLLASAQRKTLDRVAYVQGTVEKLPSQIAAP